MVSNFGSNLTSHLSLLVADINEEKNWYERELQRIREEFEDEKKQLIEVENRRKVELNLYNEQVADAEEKIRFFRAEKQLNHSKMVELFEQSTKAHTAKDYTTANSTSKDGKRYRKAMRSDRGFQIFWIRQLKEIKESFVDMYKAEFDDRSEKVAELSAEIAEIEAAIRLLHEKIIEKQTQYKKAANF